MDISQKSIGVLIDELITTSLKCWFAQEVIMNSTDEKELVIAAKKAQLTNARRSALIRAIDQRLGEGDFSPTEKTYA
jgi:hypothetical protein